jgi:hypothetical protein
MADARVTVRLSAGQSAKLTDMAAAAGCSMADALRRLIDAADGVAEQTVEPLDVDGRPERRHADVPSPRGLRADVGLAPGHRLGTDRGSFATLMTFGRLSGVSRGAPSGAPRRGIGPMYRDFVPMGGARLERATSCL